MPCHPHAQPTQHTSAVTPARALFRREKFTHMTSDASSVSITLEPPPSASRRALLTGEHPLQLRAFVGCHGGFSAQPHDWNRLYFHFCWVYHICSKLGSYDIHAPA
ncbi:hypothetical protein GLYMA_14G195800v4 [Glycine max]|uniref:Uncharacterized protein n=1 Tax=Glycine max TaxID=3847 RepID=K7M822_SOYBN|nr:hypothetical protein GYH30_040577 [Glycine max]KRH17067.1 hypothetical protein GLYMA_14G195800v4 [Glycine max]